MTIQPLLHPSPPRSRFVTVISWLYILSGASIVFSTGTAIVLGGPTFRLVAALVGGVLAGIAGAGLNQREEWARQGFVFVQGYAIVGALVDVARGPLRFGALLSLALGLALSAWIIGKLRSPAVRAEFDDSD